MMHGQLVLQLPGIVKLLSNEKVLRMSYGAASLWVYLSFVHGWKLYSFALLPESTASWSIKSSGRKRVLHYSLTDSNYTKLTSRSALDG